MLCDSRVLWGAGLELSPGSELCAGEKGWDSRDKGFQTLGKN